MQYFCSYCDCFSEEFKKNGAYPTDIKTNKLERETMMHLQPEIRLLTRVVTMAKVLSEQNGSDHWLVEIEQAYKAVKKIVKYISDNERVKDA